VQLAELAELVETGPDRVAHGVVRWRRIDLQQVVAERSGVAYHERTIGKLLKQLSRLARPNFGLSAMANQERGSHFAEEKKFPLSR
jgi:hypothetical protein